MSHADRQTASSQNVTPSAYTHTAPSIGLPFLLAVLLASCSPNQPPTPIPPAPLPLEQQVERLKEIQARHEAGILALPGVLGIGIGRSEGALVFSVLFDRSQPQPDVPAQIEGVAVRMQPRDPIQLLHGFPACGDTSPCHADQQPLPVEMGNSGSWVNQTGSGACSLGFKACDLETRQLVFVTNSHCNQNKTTCALATPGAASDFWMHPGRMDVQTSGNCFTNGGCSAIGDIKAHAAPSCNSNNNFTDATKVESSVELTSNAFRDIGFAQAGPGNPMPGDPVRKSSRTTGNTAGEIVNIGVSYDVPPPAPGVNGYCCGALTMKDQIEWLPSQGATAGGDSGSALLSDEAEFQVVGLNWGSDGVYSYANHIDRVLSALGLSLNFISCLQECVFTSMAGVLPEAEATITLGHRFREQVLEKSPRGRQYANVYYQVSAEAVRIVAANPGLLLETAKLFQSQRSVIESLTGGGSAKVSRGDLDAVDGLLEEYQVNGSDSLRKALDMLRRDLRDSDALADFRVSVE